MSLSVNLKKAAFSGSNAMSTKQAVLVASRNGIDLPETDKWEIPTGAAIHLQDLSKAHAARGQRPLEPATKQLVSLATLNRARIQGDWPSTFFVVR